MKKIEECFLYTFIDGAYLKGRDPVEIARALVDGGSDLIQIRFKEASRDEILRVAEAVHPLTQAASVGLVINDAVEVAAAMGAEYVHLGQEDFFDAHYRKVQEVSQGHSFQVGLSSHAPEQALRAVEAGALYLGVGPVFSTQTKPQAVPVSLEYVRWASAHIRIPWFAIGGVNLTNIDRVLGAGARRICVVSDILNAEDIAQQCQKYRAILDAAR